MELQEARRQVAFFESIGPGDPVYEGYVEQARARGSDNPEAVADVVIRKLVCVCCEHVVVVKRLLVTCLALSADRTVETDGF